MELRDYQAAAVQSVYDYLSDGKGDAPLIVAPTGAGKSVILSELCRRALTEYPGTRIVVVTHVKELIGQNFAALMRLWPEAPAGIFSAGLGLRQVRQITFAGIQTVARKAAAFGAVDLLVVDECHLIPRSGSTQYQTFIAGLRAINPAMRIVGLTATPFRLDSGRLDAGDGAVFDGIAYDVPITLLVTRGHLAPLVSKRPGTTFDMTGIHTRGGDWVEGEMDARFNTEAVTRAAVAEIVTLGADRRSWLLFCISVDHARKVRDELRRAGVAAETVTGDTPPEARARVLADFKAGRLRAVTNVNVLTTGFDAPATDLLAFLRPTQSLGLYMQMAGRGMRTAPGKANCLVLDYAGNVERHGPVDAINVASAGNRKGGKDGDGEAPSKTCPACQSILWIAARECPDCGFSFPEPAPKIERRASTHAIMNMTAEDDWRPVTDFRLARHERDGIASVRAEYLVDGRVVKEWVCFDHAGFARQKAVQWWQAFAGTTPPDSVAEALSRAAEVRRPVDIVVQREGKYDRAHRVRWHRPQVAGVAA